MDMTNTNDNYTAYVTHVTLFNILLDLTVIINYFNNM